MRILVVFLMAEFSIMSSPFASEKPFSFKDTPGKLPKDVVPTDYSVRIVPDIDKLTFAGTETVKLTARRRVRQLVLNALELKIEATDARRFFPCWDEPVFRARFQLTAIVPENWLAVSNMPVESEKKIAGGKEVRFAATPPMSSYLNVFVAGELDFIESRSGPTQL